MSELRHVGSISRSIQAAIYLYLLLRPATSREIAECFGLTVHLAAAAIYAMRVRGWVLRTNVTQDGYVMYEAACPWTLIESGWFK